MKNQPVESNKLKPARAQINQRWWFLLPLFWAAIIFFQSSRTAVQSDEQSYFIVSFINTFVSSLFGRELMLVSNHLVRKLAHFTEYALFGSMLVNAFIRNTFLRPLLVTILVGVLYAASDEIHQYFVPGRSMRFFDVCIDSAGILFGTFCTRWLLNKHKTKHTFKESV